MTCSAPAPLTRPGAWPTTRSVIDVQHGTPAERFWAKVDRDDLDDDCWVWTAAQHERGYGLFRPSHAAPMVRAHRYAYEMLVGPIPEGLELDHLCRNTACVNPDHLEPVTHSENVRRWHASRVASHCKHGHPFSDENLSIRRDGRRVCRACNRERQRRYRKSVVTPNERAWDDDE